MTLGMSAHQVHFQRGALSFVQQSLDAWSLSILVENEGRKMSLGLQEGQREVQGSQSPVPSRRPLVLNKGALWKGCHTKMAPEVLAREMMASKKSGKPCPLPISASEASRQRILYLIDQSAK